MADQPKIILCPYCGHTQTTPDKCESCGGRFDLLSRRATQISMGPWFVRDPKRPFLPGCSYEVLKLRISSGKVKALSVIRGPTTRQFWSIARNVPGVANLLGYCHKCGATVQPADRKCNVCSTSFSLQEMRVPDSDELGLLFPTRELAVAAQKVLDAEIEKVLGKAPDASGKKGELPIGASQLQTGSGDTGMGLPAINGDLPGADLLDDILNIGPAAPAKPAVPPPSPTPAAPTPTPSAPPRPASTAAPAIKGPTNDDLPDEDPKDDSEEDEQPRRRKQSGISPLTILLICIIVAMAILIVVIMLRFGTPAAPNAGTTPGIGAEPTPRAPAPAPRPVSARPVQEPVAVAAPAGAPAQMSIFDTPPARSEAPAASAPPAAPEPAAAPATAPAAAPAPAPAPNLTGPKPLPMPEAIEEAKKLEAAGKNTQALAVLKASVAITPLKDRPADFDDLYRRIESKASLDAVPRYMQAPAEMRK